MSPSEERPKTVVRSRETRVQARRRRQTFTFLGLFAFVGLIGFVALGNWEGWWTIGGRAEAAAVTCPVQVVIDPHETRVNVLNGTGRHGLAAAVAKEMQSRGFVVLAINSETEQKPLQAVAFVRYGPSGRLQAHTVALEFPGQLKLINDKRTSQTVDVVLGEKYKAMTSRAKAKAATTPKADPDGCIDPTPTSSPTPSSTALS